MVNSGSLARDVPHPGRPGRIRRADRDRRGARHGGRDRARLQAPARDRACSHRQRTRRDRRHRGHLHRQRHARRGGPRRRAGRTGQESHADLDADAALAGGCRRCAARRARLMGLGDVTPPPSPRSRWSRRPRRRDDLHAHLHPGPAAPLDRGAGRGQRGDRAGHTRGDRLGAGGLPAGVRYDVEHATGHLEVEADIDTSGPLPRFRRCGVVRTARKLFDGYVFPRPGCGTTPGTRMGEPDGGTTA